MWIEICLYDDTSTWHLVTPYAGVWIEITHIHRICQTWWSLPTRECGLKFGLMLYKTENVITSLPTRECGLKFVKPLAYCTLAPVTPYAGVWIEICKRQFKDRRFGHSLRGSVDWNCSWPGVYVKFSSHSLRGSVDWNFFHIFIMMHHPLSLPTRECGLKFTDWMGYW